MVKKILILLLTVVSVLCIVLITGVVDNPFQSRHIALPDLPPIQEDMFLNEKSAIGTPDDPNARRTYFYDMLKDPNTQEIPAGIRTKELEFAKSLPKKSGPGAVFRTQQHIDWKSIGPFNRGGRTRAVGIDITDEKVVLAGGVTGGMWRSENAGIEWELVTTPQNIHSVTCIVQDTRPSKSKTWYYGTGEIQGNSARAPFAPFRGDGIFKSIDGGKTWKLLSSTTNGETTRFNSQFQYIWNIVTNPFNSEEDEVLAAIVGAIVRSTDGGKTWEYVLGDQHPDGGDLDLNQVSAARFTDVRITTDGTYYAAISSAALDNRDQNAGLYRSENGTTWTNITPAGWPFNFSRVVIGPSPSNPDEVYFLGNTEENDILWKYRYISGNGSGFGGEWVNLSENIPAFGGDLGDYDAQGSYNMLIKVHPEDPETVFIGGTNLYRSTDGYFSSEHSAWIGGYDTANNFEIYPNHYVDQHDLVFYPSDPDKMISANDGGVFQNSNNKAEGISWIPLNNGFVTSQYYTIAFDDHSEGGFVIGGLQDNGTQIAKSPKERTQWTRFLGGDGAFSAVSKDQQYVYASFQESQVYRFTIGDNFNKTSFARVDPVGGGEAENQEYLFVNPFVLDPNNNNIMYLAGGNIVWRNNNVTQIPSFRQQKTSVNWETIQDSEISDGRISAMTASTNPAHIVYYGTTNGRLFKIDNAHTTAARVTEITGPDFPDNGYLKSIAVNKNNAEELLITFSNYNIPSVFYSTNGGENFTDVSGNLEENIDGSGNGPSVRWGEVVPLNEDNAVFYLATSTGAYSTSELNGFNTVWEQEGAETIGNVVSVMVKHRDQDGSVFVATHGRGLFKGTISDVAQTNYSDPPEGFNIENPYPNPFTKEVKIPFTVPEDGPVRVKILNLLGQDIKTLMWSYMYAGKNHVTWDGTNPSGAPVAEGIYLCQFEYKNNKSSERIFFYR